MRAVAHNGQCTSRARAARPPGAPRRERTSAPTQSAYFECCDVGVRDDTLQACCIGGVRTPSTRALGMLSALGDGTLTDLEHARKVTV